MDARSVVGGVLILGSLAIIPIQTLVTGDDPRTSDPGDRTRVHLLDPGDCFDGGPTLERQSEITVINCSDPHDSELFRVEHFSTYGTEGQDAEREAVAVGSGAWIVIETIVTGDDPHDSFLIMNEHVTTYFSHDLAKAEREARAACADDFEEYVATLPADTGVELRLYHGDEGRGIGKQRWIVACVAWSADGRFDSG